MTNALDPIFTSNVAAIVTAAGFLWYLTKRDKLMQDTYDRLADEIGKLGKAIKRLQERMDSEKAPTRRGRPRKNL